MSRYSYPVLVGRCVVGLATPQERLWNLALGVSLAKSERGIRNFAEDAPKFRRG